MRVVIFHYHLNPGGVTSVILAQIKALQIEKPGVEIILLTGHCDEDLKKKLPKVKIVVNKSLYYQDDAFYDYKKEVDSVLTIFRQYCSESDILHAHNPTLGKNPAVTVALTLLAQEGYNIVNHAHDFAEDRPYNLQLLKNTIEKSLMLDLQKTMYPPVSNYHFIVLNSSDEKRLIEYHVDKSRITRVPNPSELPEQEALLLMKSKREKLCNELGLTSSKKIVTYPVRVIQRKNIGEFILLACIFSNEANWLVTQPPKNPVEIQLYNQWKEFCQEENIKIFWEAGTKTYFQSLISISDFCITTSYREGFGLVFLEPWLYHTPVVGRDISSVTTDLKNSGLHYPCLYSKLLVENNSEMHELEMKEQMGIIRRCKSEKNFRELILFNNIYLSKLLNPVDVTLIKDNIEVILKEYSLEKFGKRLYEVYQRITK